MLGSDGVNTVGAGSDRLSIAHVAAPARFGGLEQVLQALAVGHRERGHDVLVVSAVAGPGSPVPYEAALARSGVRHVRLPSGGRRYVREASRLRALLGDEGTRDIVHTHGYRMDVLGGWAGRRVGARTITTVHGFTGGGLKNRVYEYVQERAMRHFDAVVAVSKPMATRLEARGVSRSRLHVVPNAWRSLEFEEAPAAREVLGVSPRAYHIGWVGRMSREKGADVLLEALSLLPGPDAGTIDVSFVGDGPDRSELQSRAAEQGLAPQIHWHGQVPDAARLFRAFDLLVLSSRTEGTPIVLLEALAAGVPVVATRVGGVPDVVTEAEALLVDSEDPHGLARAIRAVREAPDAAAARTRRGKERLRSEYALDPWLSRYESIYRGALDAPGKE